MWGAWRLGVLLTQRLQKSSFRLQRNKQLWFLFQFVCLVCSKKENLDVIPSCSLFVSCWCQSRLFFPLQQWPKIIEEPGWQQSLTFSGWRWGRFTDSMAPNPIPRASEMHSNRGRLESQWGVLDFIFKLPVTHSSTQTHHECAQFSFYL